MGRRPGAERHPRQRAICVVAGLSARDYSLTPTEPWPAPTGARMSTRMNGATVIRLKAPLATTSLMLVVLATAVLAQTSSKSATTGDAPPAAQTSEAKEAPAALSVEEAIRAAVAALDRADELEDEGSVATAAEEIKGYINVVAAKAPGNPWLHYLYGRIYVLTGRRSDALDELRQFVETREGRNAWRAHDILGRLLAGEFPGLARTYLQRANSLKPGEPTTLVGLSQCAQRLGRPEEALRYAREAVSADGRENREYITHLARIAAAQGKWDLALREAEAALDKALAEMKRRPGHRSPTRTVDDQYKLIMDILRGKKGSMAEPADIYLSLVKYARARVETTTMLARLDVLSILERAIQETEPHVPVQIRLEYALELEKLGRDEDAIAAFEEVLETEPDNSVAVARLAELRSPASTGE